MTGHLAENTKKDFTQCVVGLFELQAYRHQTPGVVQLDSLLFVSGQTAGSSDFWTQPRASSGSGG